MSDTNGTTPALSSATPERKYRSGFTGYLNNGDQHYDPWQHLSIPGLFPAVRVRFCDGLPFGTWGLTNFDAMSVTMTAGMNAAEIRATLAHELVHLERGSVADDDDIVFEEKICDLIAASRLISCADLNGLGGRVEEVGAKAAAVELEVDEMTIEVAVALEALVASMINDKVGSSGIESKPADQKVARVAGSGE